ncbi:hypothetical protein EV424DRAFT_1608412 [Suillus variegatus]|nr:hypothetical protein EV424DRAFT_1608412 [Suillus variegatus]
MDQSVLVYSLTALAISLPCLSPPLIITRPSEKTYRSRKSLKDPLSLPYLADAASIDLSVIIPAYNETSHLPSMLEMTLDHLNTTSIRQTHTYKLIIIDNGSKDDTPALARLLERGNMRWRGGRWEMGMERRKPLGVDRQDPPMDRHDPPIDRHNLPWTDVNLSPKTS